MESKLELIGLPDKEKCQWWEDKQRKLLAELIRKENEFIETNINMNMKRLGYEFDSQEELVDILGKVGLLKITHTYDDVVEYYANYIDEQNKGQFLFSYLRKVDTDFNPDNYTYNVTYE